MPMRAALDKTTHRDSTWEVPNNLENRAAMWPLLPLTAGQIRSLTSFTVRSKFFSDADALDPDWLGLEIRKMSESGWQKKVGFIWHWCGDGTGMVPLRIESREFLTHLVSHLPKLLRGVSEQDAKLFLELVQEEASELVEKRTINEETYFDFSTLEAHVDDKMGWWSH
jgi:hypothetical protein